MNADSLIKPSLRKVIDIEVNVAAPMLLGELAGVERKMVQIIGGKLAASDFSGTILPGGSDIQMVRANGTIDLVARYAVDLGAHGKLLIENTGLRRAAPAKSSNNQVYFRGAVHFDAPSGPLEWLNDSVFVSCGYREGNKVCLEVFELL